jgi:hypothetical protein
MDDLFPVRGPYWKIARVNFVRNGSVGPCSAVDSKCHVILHRSRFTIVVTTIPQDAALIIAGHDTSFVAAEQKLREPKLDVGRLAMKT